MIDHKSYITNLTYIHYNCVDDSEMTYEWLHDNLVVAESECSVLERAQAMEFSLAEEKMKRLGLYWNEGEMTDYESAMYDFLKFDKITFV